MRRNPGAQGTAGETAAATFGVEIDDRRMLGLIEKGAPLPVHARRLFTTVSDMQTAVEINVLRVDGPSAQVSLEIDRDGIVRASARDLDTGARQEVAFSQGVPFDKASASGEDTEGLRLRVMGLVHRLREESGSMPRHEHPLLREEIDEIVARIVSSLSTQSREDLFGYRSALETLLGEIRALRAPRPIGPFEGGTGRG